MTKKKLYFGLLPILLFVINCGTQGDTAPETSGQNESSKTEKTTSLVPVEAIIIQTKAIEQKISFTGRLDPLHKVDIVAEVSGQIEAIYKELGDRITSRDTLAKIDDKIPYSNYLQAEAQAYSAENNLEIARLNLKSDEDLFNSGDISELAFQNSKLAVKTAEANRLSALATLRLMKKHYFDTRITSPISGIISRKYIDLGTMVTINQPIYQVVDLKKMKIQIGIPQDLISQLEVGSPCQIDVSALNNKTFNGSVRYISPNADEASGSFLSEIQVDNTRDYQLLSGMTAKVEITFEQMGQQLAVPDYAVVTQNGSDAVFQIFNNKAKLVPVKIRSAFGSDRIIESGVSAGDTIVVVGMKNLGVSSPVYIESLHKSKEN